MVLYLAQPDTQQQKNNEKKVLAYAGGSFMFFLLKELMLNFCLQNSKVSQ